MSTKVNSLSDLATVWNEEHPNDKIVPKCIHCDKELIKGEVKYTIEEAKKTAFISHDSYEYIISKHGYSKKDTMCLNCFFKLNKELKSTKQKSNEPWYMTEGKLALSKMTDEEKEKEKAYAKEVLDFIEGFQKENLFLIPSLLKARAKLATSDMKDMLVIGDLSMKLQAKFNISPAAAVLYLKAYTDGIYNSLTKIK